MRVDPGDPDEAGIQMGQHGDPRQVLNRLIEEAVRQPAESLAGPRPMEIGKETGDACIARKRRAFSRELDRAKRFGDGQDRGPSHVGALSRQNRAPGGCGRWMDVPPSVHRMLSDERHASRGVRVSNPHGFSTAASAISHSTWVSVPSHVLVQDRTGNQPRIRFRNPAVENAQGFVQRQRFLVSHFSLPFGFSRCSFRSPSETHSPQVWRLVPDRPPAMNVQALAQGQDPISLFSPVDFRPCNPPFSYGRRNSSWFCLVAKAGGRRERSGDPRSRRPVSGRQRGVSRLSQCSSVIHRVLIWRGSAVAESSTSLTRRWEV